MPSLPQDLRVALRTFSRRPGFAAVVALTLALGIGATTALFSVVYGVLLRPLPYAGAERLVSLWQTARDNPKPEAPGSVSHLNFLEWRRDARTVDSMALYSRATFTLNGLGDAEVIPGGVVTPDFFTVFAAPPALGRGFGAEEDRPGGPRVAVIGYGFWQERLGGRRDVLGTALEISGIPRTIVGVAAEGFDFPAGARLWTPVANDDGNCGRACVYLDGVGRLAEGASVEGARAELAAIGGRLEDEYPDANTNVAIGLSTLAERLVGDVRRPILLLFASVGLLLLIACANVANLLLVRGAARQQEMAVRAALGASRGRIVRALLTESVLLALAGAGGGLLLAAWGVDGLHRLAPASLPRLDEVGLGVQTVVFAVAVSLVTAVLFGLGPALALVRTPLARLIGSRGDAGDSRRRWARSGLLAAEVALSLVLLVGAGLLLRSMERLQAIDPGWRADGVTIFTVVLPASAYPTPAAVATAYDRLDEQLGSLPGIERVGRINGLPLGPSENVLDFARPDRPPPAPGQVPVALYRIVDPDYFATVGIPIVVGRGFDARDGADGPPAIVISEEMAREYWPGEEAVGRTVEIGGRTRTIVGLARGVRSSNIEQPPQAEVYVPHAQTSARSMTFVLRSARSPGVVLGEAREVVRAADARLPLIRPGTMTALEEAAMARPRFYLLLLGLFAVLAVTLAGVGIYGVVAYAVAMRRREIGVRVALGAGAGDVLRLVVWQGLRPALAGVAAGLAGALAAGRLFAGILYEVRPTDPVVFAGGAVLVLLTVIAACLVPARRALSIPAAIALREE